MQVPKWWLFLLRLLYAVGLFLCRQRFLLTLLLHQPQGLPMEDHQGCVQRGQQVSDRQRWFPPVLLWLILRTYRGRRHFLADAQAFLKSRGRLRLRILFLHLRACSSKEVSSYPSEPINTYSNGHVSLLLGLYRLSVMLAILEQKDSDRCGFLFFYVPMTNWCSKAQRIENPFKFIGDYNWPVLAACTAYCETEVAFPFILICRHYES